MAKLVHEIDPNPDTVLILKKSCKIFAAWPASVPVQASPELIESPAGEVLPASSPSYEQIGGRGSNAKQKRLAMMKRASFQGNPVVTTTAEPRVVPNFVQKSAHVHMDMVGSGTAGTDHTKESAAPTPADLAKASASTGDEEEVHYHVSSRHLILGSKIFRTMMTEEKWQQGFREEDGLFHSQTEGWDADALLILMNILHAKNNQVPLSLSLEMVAKIAVLVDYYECDMAVQLFASMWIQPLTTNPGVPYFYCRNLMLWMCIARVFERADIFESTTLIALEESKDSIETLELPIWPSIVGDIENRRYQAIESLMSSLHELLDTYQSTLYICPHSSEHSFQCGSFLLGALTKQMAGLGILLPRPEVPFQGMSLRTLRSSVRNVKSPIWCHENNGYESSYQHPCSLSQTLNELVDNSLKKVTGLKLHHHKVV